MVVEQTQEIGEGLDLVPIALLINDFLRFLLLIAVINLENNTVRGGADFKFHGGCEFLP